MVSSSLCPAVHILGSQNVCGRAEGIADHYWPWAVFSSSLGPASLVPRWMHHTVSVFSILHLVLTLLIVPKKELAPRIFGPLISAIVFLLRKLSRAKCLSKWQTDIEEALADVMKVRELNGSGISLLLDASSVRPSVRPTVGWMVRP